LSSNDDPEIVIKLPLSQLQTVVQQLGSGAYRDVAIVVTNICQQAEPQVRAAETARQPIKPDESVAAPSARPH
jgi:hypothetical protein